MAQRFRHEEVAAVPRGYRVRTVHSGEHEIRIAVPPGRRRRGAGVLVSILHPTGENPSRCRNAHSSVFSYAVSLGYPYLRGEGRVAKDDRTWLSRVTKHADGSGPAIFVGWDSVGRKWIIEREGKNPDEKKKGESTPAYHERRVRELLAKMPKAIRDVFNRKNNRKNPEEQLAAAEDLFREFHGRDPEEILQLQESAEIRGEYTSLGGAVKLIFEAPNGNEVVVKFRDADGVKVASSPDGHQLYFVGGNQDISEQLDLFGSDTTKDFIDLGFAVFLSYDAAKWQTNFDPVIWEHRLGEESGIRPRGFFDKIRKRIYFAGGNYKVERPGIVD